jgi:hypothetical protein
MTFMGWEFRQHGDKSWSASLGSDTVSIEDGALVVTDSTRYYPGGSYTVPLAVIDKLRERNP